VKTKVRGKGEENGKSVETGSAVVFGVFVFQPKTKRLNRGDHEISLDTRGLESGGRGEAGSREEDARLG